MSFDIQINKPKPQRDSEENEQIETVVARKTNIYMAKQKLKNIIMTIVLIIALSLSGYLYYKLNNLQKNTDGKQETQEAQDLLAKVAKLYLIPTGEEPTVATVSDPMKLKDQAFFSSSQKDDKVLIFTKAGKAVLYRPSINKIIEITPINNSQKDATPPEKTAEPIKDKTF